MFAEVILLLIGLSIVCYFYVTRNNSYWANKCIPYKKPQFFFGNFKDALIGKKNFGVVYRDIYKEFPNAPIVGIYVLSHPTILLKDLDIIKNVLVSNFSSFMDNDFEVNLNDDKIWATNPFSNKGEQWKAVRSRWVPHLTQLKLKTTYGTLVSKSKELVEYLNGEIQKNPNKQYILKNLVSNFFLDYVISGIFGININSFENADNIFKQVKDQIFVSSFLNSFITNSFMVAPWLGKFISMRFVNKDMEKKLMTVARDIIKLRKETGKPNTDIYDALQKYSEQDGKSTFSELDLAGRIFGVMLDGSETTANPIVFGLYELACNPEIQDKLRSEVAEAANEEEGEISFDRINKLPYLDQVCSEILRMYTPLSHLSKLCTKDTTIEVDNKVIHMKEGSVLVVPVYAIHTDPKYHPDPFKFDPERFTEEAKEKIPKFAYMPFGEGPRICTGMKLGLLESKVLLATMVQNFQLIPNYKLPRPIPMDPHVFVYRPTVDLSISLKPIK